VRRWLVILLGLLALIAVLYVFVSPAVDLDPTTTRAWQIALLLLCAPAFLCHVLAGRCTVQRRKRRECFVYFALSPHGSTRQALELDCSRLC